jgi:hypothetical protein
VVKFHTAVPHPSTPFFFAVVEKGWFRPGTRWEELNIPPNSAKLPRATGGANRALSATAVSGMIAQTGACLDLSDRHAQPNDVSHGGGDRAGEFGVDAEVVSLWPLAVGGW